MAFRCPECHARSSLRIMMCIELPPDNRLDEITLQVVTCSLCSFHGVAIFEESRRGSFDRDDWDHTGYYYPDDELAQLMENMRHCPNPSHPDCTCETHRILGKLDPSGRWQGLRSLVEVASFPMRMAT